MAAPGFDTEPVERLETPVQLSSFEVSGLFGYLNHSITFPLMSPLASQPEILIVEGQNGTGKTTIMKMIAGITRELDFGIFRVIPFTSASLKLSNGDVVGVRYDPTNAEYPVIATFRGHTVSLVKDKVHGIYTPNHRRLIDLFRAEALPILHTIDFEFITIERSIEVETKSMELVFDQRTGEARHRPPRLALANKVRAFLRDAQVNYRRFFQAEELELLPRILRRFAENDSEYEPAGLLSRIELVRRKNAAITRFGLQTDDKELATLTSLLENGVHNSEPHAISLLASYVEIHENRSQARNLIATRLSLFENIMDEFFVGKKIRISEKSGFQIESESGRLTEKDLSSGEYHFLYMMVSALLCERAGTIIAIDEPELSLHVSWQRRLIGALSKCATGASPLLFLSTHATAISASHKYAVQTLSAID